ncbi:MAG: hypothetical protein J7K20_02070 [Thermodesulfobacterium sp.]|nr:hypothetical protein [Thermodesulfobacterium sp.]
MIDLDVKMVSQAKEELNNPLSYLRYRLRSHYENKIYHIKQVYGKYAIPFKDEFESEIAFIKDYMLIKGWEGLLEIKKVYYRKKLYYFKEPFKIENYKIFGKFSGGKLIGFLVNTKYGFHTTGEWRFGYYSLCFGDFTPKDSYDTFKSFKEDCEKLAKVLETIHIGSLGDCALPGNQRYKKIIIGDEEGAADIVEWIRGMSLSKLKILLKNEILKEVL